MHFFLNVLEKVLSELGVKEFRTSAKPAYSNHDYHDCSLPALCRPGYYSDNGFQESFSPCQPCPRGAYQSSEGQTTCLVCPDGSGTSTEGSTSVENCTGNLVTGGRVGFAAKAIYPRCPLKR